MSRMSRYGILLIGFMAVGWDFRCRRRPATPKISDEAGFFSKEAVEKATDKLNDIQRRFKVEVVIETYAAIPDAMKADYKPENKADYFKQWAEKRAMHQSVKGVYTLICKDPAYLYMEPDKAVRRKAFTLDDRNALVARVRKQMHEKKFDEALAEIVDSIDTTLSAHLAPRKDSNRDTP